MTHNSIPPSGPDDDRPRGIWPGWYDAIFSLGLTIFLIWKAEELGLCNRVILFFILKAAPIVFTAIMIPVLLVHLIRRNLRWVRADVIAMGIAVVILAGTSMFFLYLQRPRPQGCMTACKSNLKNIGTALEMYNADNSSQFPEHLTQVTPNYLKVIPTCASAGVMTYEYVHSDDRKQYTVFCKGPYHTNLYGAENFPQYSSIHGLVEEPEYLKLIQEKERLRKRFIKK